MALETKITAKLITGLQNARNELELAGDAEGAANLTSAISCVIMASGEAEKPAATQEQLDDLQRMAALCADFYRKSIYTNDFIVKNARVQAFGTRRIVRRSAQPVKRK